MKKLKVEIHNRQFTIDTENMTIWIGGYNYLLYFTIVRSSELFVYDINNGWHCPINEMYIDKYIKFTCVKDYIDYIKGVM